MLLMEILVARVSPPCPMECGGSACCSDTPPTVDRKLATVWSTLMCSSSEFREVTRADASRVKRRDGDLHERDLFFQLLRRWLSRLDRSCFVKKRRNFHHVILLLIQRNFWTLNRSMVDLFVTDDRVMEGHRIFGSKPRVCFLSVNRKLGNAGV